MLKKINKSIENPKIEYGYGLTLDRHYFELEQINDKRVDVPKDKKEEYQRKGLLMLGHSHPFGESPLGSAKDMGTYTAYSSRIGLSFNENGIFLVLNKKYKRNKHKANDIKKDVSDIIEVMIEDFEKNKFKDESEINSLIENDKDKYDAMLHEYVIKNYSRYINQYNQKLNKYGIKVIFINFKKYI